MSKTPDDAAKMRAYKIAAVVLGFVIVVTALFGEVNTPPPVRANRESDQEIIEREAARLNALSHCIEYPNSWRC